VRSRQLFTILAAGVLLAACQPKADTAGLAADEKAIRDLEARWNAMIAARDLVGVVGLYAEDGAMLAAGTPMAKGPTAVGEAWKGLFATPGLNLVITPVDIRVAGSRDLASDRGTYALTLTDPNGQQVNDKGKYVVVWKKVGDDWKVDSDMFSSDLPAPVPATATAPAAPATTPAPAAPPAT